jgi:hypothetical protein
MSKQVGLGWKWASQFSKVDITQLRALYSVMHQETIETLNAKPGATPITVEQLEHHMSFTFESDKGWGFKTHKCSDAALHLLTLAGQYTRAHNQQTFIPPSQETIAQGGFLGGEVINNTTEAHQRLNALVARFFPGLEMETVGGYS